jgi:Glycosyltransferase family 87
VRTVESTRARRSWDRLTGVFDLRALGVPAFAVVAGVLVVARLLDVYPWNAPVFDLHTYWSTRFGVDYTNLHAGPAGAYLYSPAFAQLIWPLTRLPLPMFAAIWTAIGAVLLIWLTGRFAFILGLLPAIALTIAQGQLDLAFAAVAVVGFRWPIAWALPLLTKVTPGVGVAWFLFRREWRSLAIALGGTAVIIAASTVIEPQWWTSWFGMLGRMDFPTTNEGLVFIPVALWLRLPIALALVAWGASTNRAWTVPVATCLGMPIVWLNSPTILVGVLPLIALGADSTAGRWIRREVPSLFDGASRSTHSTQVEEA